MRALITVTLLVLALAPAAPAAAETRASLPDIEDEVMCPICGTLLQLSDAPQAERERAFIRARIDQGQSKEEIKDALVDEYGPEVLATPESSGFDLSAWIVPALGLLVALVALGLGAKRLSRRGRGPKDEPEPLSPEDSARLERDISSYEL
jgi:cytochrome c-type biogenesis protein CcmH